MIMNNQYKKTNKAIGSSVRLGGLSLSFVIPFSSIVAVVFIILRAIDFSMKDSFLVALCLFIAWVLVNGGNNTRYPAMLIRNNKPSYRKGKRMRYHPLLPSSINQGGGDR